MAVAPAMKAVGLLAVATEPAVEAAGLLASGELARALARELARELARVVPLVPPTMKMKALQVPATKALPVLERLPATEVLPVLAAMLFSRNAAASPNFCWE